MKRKSILIVDDNSFNIMALKFQLETLIDNQVEICEAIIPSQGIEIIVNK